MTLKAYLATLELEGFFRHIEVAAQLYNQSNLPPFITLIFSDAFPAY